MKILFIPLLLTSCFIKVNAQTKYEPGFIITIDSDTINGFLLDEIDANMAYGIEFKKTPQDFQPKKIKSFELLGFGFNNGRIFERIQISENRDLQNDSSSVLVKKIVTGK
jgi:hypothetical protein